jgi:hypothetical protein
MFESSNEHFVVTERRWVGGRSYKHGAPPEREHKRDEEL